MATRPPRPWHSTALAAVLATWALYMLTMWLRLATGHFRIRALLLFVIFLIPLLTGLGAYLLFTGNKLRLIPFLVLPIMEIWGAILLFPDQLNPGDWELGIGYFSHFPLGTRVVVAIFFACAIYCLILNRRESVHMASNKRWRGP
jgi:hypothetical protein